ncbi:actin depolymerizing factor [Boletus reticuloceps]|uniref:Cofilin n=1 Tax=Boletus reticuloceps TaxID=495285 RepID=A0A8I2YEG2_9AGAM|nr:actin depolymerizing factor [Boletus reticuloceps]
MASGVQVTDDCLRTFQNLKLGKKLKYIIFNLNKELTEIVVEKSSEDSDYEKFIEELPTDGCRWAVYDFSFEKEGEGRRNKLCFISWAPDTARVKTKMVFASSRDGLRRKLDGIALEIQGTDLEEVSHKTVLAKAMLGTR